MQRRDRENREVRQAGRERMRDTRHKIIQVTNRPNQTKLTVEEWQAIEATIVRGEALRKKRLFRMKIGVLLVCSVVVCWLIWLFLF